MCLLFVYINPKPLKNVFKLILAFNREEFYSRHTKPATIIPGKTKIIAGTDLATGREGGTWLGLAETGGVAALLNTMQAQGTALDPATVEGRGFLAINYLTGDITGNEYLQGLAQSKSVYNKFNLVIMEPETENTKSELLDQEISPGQYKLLYFNNTDKEVLNCGTGVHAFGNSFVDKPFRKVARGKEKLEEIIRSVGVDMSNEAKLIDSLMDMMQDKEQMYPDEVLRQQGSGYSEDFLKSFSSIWMSIPTYNYGSRTTSIVLVDGANRAVFKERTLKEPVNIDAPQWDDSTYTMQLRAA